MTTETSQSSDTQAPVVEDLGTKENVTTTTVVQNTQPAPPSTWESKINSIKQNGTVHEKTLISALESYIEKMKPKKIVPEHEGARNQYNLWKAISFVVENSPAEEFRRLWNILLAYFEEYRNDVFHERYVCRFTEYWTWSEKELNGLLRTINILKLTSNQATRAANLKQVDLDRSTTDGFSDAARQRILTFYKG